MELRCKMENQRLKRAKMRLNLYYEAEEQILSGAQSYNIGSRSLTRADLGKIQEEINKLESEVKMLEKSNGKRKVRRVIPVDS